MSTHARHTPGPWIATGDSGRLAVEASPHGMVASIRCLGNAPERVSEECANARLIAAAPELLAACEHAAAVLAEDGGPSDYDERMRAAETARAAIAKAREEGQ